MTRSDPRLNQAYDHCATITRRHYENFPVASLLLPAKLRRPISVIYAFARTADDFADEGGIPDEQRLALLDGYARALDALNQHSIIEEQPIFIALCDVVNRHQLSIGHFHDLLTAFRMDVKQKRYASFTELSGYCRYSANPIGQLVLELCGQNSARNINDSDNICTALQLINFLQDIRQDYDENKRIYLPQDELAQFDIPEADISQQRNGPAMKRLIAFQTDRARTLLQSGMPLGARLPGRIGLEIRCTVMGGLRVLDAIATQPDVYARPRLGKKDWIGIIARACLRR